MNTRRNYLINHIFRRYNYIKRKYPINPAEADKLPVFEYSRSKPTYRRVFSWGNIQSGALGIPYIKKGYNFDSKKCIKSPKRLSIGEKFEVTTAACGFGFTVYAFHSEDNVKLHGTGLNTDSQIGKHEPRDGHPLEILFYPKEIFLPFKDPKNSKIIKVSAGRAHLLVLTTEGLFLMGNNAYGQCSRKIIEDEDYIHSNYINHIKMLNGRPIVDIECGQDHSLAITDDGSVFGCGWGADGQTGLGHYNNQPNFARLKGDIQNENIVKVACRSDFVLAVNDKGEVFGWGNTEYGQLSSSNGQQQVCTPTHVNFFKEKITSIAAGGTFCLAVTESGEVYSWGFGLLGLGPKVQQTNKPIMIPPVLFGRNDFHPDSKVVKVVCGLNYSAALTNHGDLLMWGRNPRGCLGLGNEKDQYFPLKVAISGHVEDVFCGVDHTVAICKPFI